MTLAKRVGSAPTRAAGPAVSGMLGPGEAVARGRCRPRAGAAGRSALDWRQYIHSDPAILTGKPVVKGTRLGAEFLLGLFAAGWNQEQILESYPSLTPE